ncbi:unnamed protein product [Rangifer tarandus platyrhynchus]|uniref:Uncharacterized protein n=2 Tax=Rangifer tarandus platyrhynchus TaxID=3082113 RepID=A0AC59Z402_RANTA|nr:unnamed protein product [Rangifer tarandus platyrhynchus]
MESYNMGSFVTAKKNDLRRFKFLLRKKRWFSVSYKEISDRERNRPFWYWAADEKQHSRVTKRGGPHFTALLASSTTCQGVKMIIQMTALREGSAHVAPSIDAAYSLSHS